jgi:hypothetical protein
MNTGSIKATFLHLAPLLLPVVTASLSSASLGQSFWIFLLSVMVPIVVVPALIIRFSGKSTDLERRHASAYLNFQVSVLIYLAVLVGVFMLLSIYLNASTSGSYQGFNSQAGLLVGLSVLVLLFFVFLIVAFIIRAALAAYKGKEYRYPIAIRFLK